MSDKVETLEWIKPRSGDDCSVYGCETSAYCRLRVGGGQSAMDIHTSSMDFCWEHFKALRSRADRLRGYGIPMTGKALRALRKSLGMSTAAAADLVHVSRRTWVAWEARARVPETGAELFRLKVGREKA